MIEEVKIVLRPVIESENGLAMVPALITWTVVEILAKKLIIGVKMVNASIKAGCVMERIIVRIQKMKLTVLLIV